MTATYRLVHHGGDGAREVVADGLELDTADVETINRAFAKTMFRLWPVTRLSPARSVLCDSCGRVTRVSVGKGGSADG